MKHIPIKEFDEEINVIVIRKPKHSLQIGAVFQSFKKLEILRIIESNVPAIGMHSFWGVPSLRILGKLTEKLLPFAGLHFHVLVFHLVRFVQKQYYIDKRRQF
jgi:hypothetical protein